MSPPQPTRRLLRLSAWIALVVWLLSGSLAWLTALRGEAILHDHTLLMAGWGGLGLGGLALAGLLATTPPDAIRLSPRASRIMIVAGAALLQGTAVALVWPGLSDDVVRYRNDGGALLSGVSPYAVAPAQRVQHADAIDRLIPYGHLHTIYLPTSQALFAVTRWAEQRLLPPPPAPDAGEWRGALARLGWRQRALVWRIVVAGLAVAASAALVSILQHAGHSGWWAALFAWHPLTVLECGGMGHQDVLGVLLVLTTLLALQRGRAPLGATLLALACGVKPIALLLVPFVFREMHRRMLRRPVLLFALVLAGLYLPLLVHADSLRGWSMTLQTYSRSWEANGSIYELLKYLAGEDGRDIQSAKDWARRLAVLLTAATALLLWFKRARVATAAYWLTLVPLLSAPVLYPWYLIWMLAMVPLAMPQRGGGWTGLVFAATVVLSYQLWREPVWRLPGPWLLAEYLPVYAALATELIFIARGLGTGPSNDGQVTARPVPIPSPVAP